MQQISQYAAAVATSAAPATATGQPVPPQPTPPGYSSTANSSATTTGPNTPTTTPTAPPPPPHTGPQPQARVVFTRPSFSPNMPASAFGTRGTTINVRAAMPGQQSGQVIFPTWFLFLRLICDYTQCYILINKLSLQAFNPAALNQMISGLVGQLLLPGQMGMLLQLLSFDLNCKSLHFVSGSVGNSCGWRHYHHIFSCWLVCVLMEFLWNGI